MQRLKMLLSNVNPSVICLRVGNVTTPISLKRSAQAKRMTLRINEMRREAVLTIPKYCKNSMAEEFLERNQDWLFEKLRALPPTIPFAHGEIIPVRDRDHKIAFTGYHRNMPVVSIKEYKTTGYDLLQIAGDPEHAPRRLKDWLKAQARADFSERVEYHAKRLKLRPKRISIRDQRSRWGSCSSNGVLSFSWRLILAPSHVLDYVAAHEVAHLEEMNHSSAFWKLVKKTMPEMEEAQQWLKDHGSRLHSYGIEI